MKKILTHTKLFIPACLLLSIFSINAMKSPHLIKSMHFDNMITGSGNFSWEANDRYIAFDHAIISMETEKITYDNSANITHEFNPIIDFVPKHDRAMLGFEKMSKFNQETGKLVESEENFDFLHLNFEDQNILDEHFSENGKTFFRVVKDGETNNLIIKNFIPNYSTGDYLVKKPIKVNTRINGSIDMLIYTPESMYLPIIYIDTNNDKKLKIINLESKKELINKNFAFEGEVDCLLPLHKNNSLITHEFITTSSKTSFKILELSKDTFKLINEITLPYKVENHRESLDENLMAVSSLENNNIEIINLKSGKIVSELVGHTNKIQSLLFSNSSEMLASVDEDGNLKIWRIEPLKIERKKQFRDVRIHTKS